MASRANGGKRAPRSNPTRFAQRMPSVAPGMSRGPRPLTMPTFVTRSGNSCPQASAYGPPPELPSTAKELSPRRSATSATSRGQSSSVLPGWTVGEPVARTVERDDSHVRFRRGVLGELRLEPRARMSVEVEAGRTVGPPVLRAADPPAVAKEQRLRVAGHDPKWSTEQEPRAVPRIRAR